MNENNISKTGDIINQTSQIVGDVLTNPYVIYTLKIGGAILFMGFWLFLAKGLASVITRKVISHASENKNIDNIIDLINDIAYYTILIVGLFIAFEIAGLDVSLILGGVSLGIGFAFKEVISNMIAGIMILMTKELRIGDIIEIQSGEGYFGRIEEISIRHTIIRTPELRQIILPNMALIEHPIKTYSSEDSIKLNIDIQVDYDIDIDQVEKLIYETVKSLDIIINKDKTKIFLNDFLDGLQFKIFFFFDPNAGFLIPHVKGIVYDAIYKTLRQNNIHIPYPRKVINTEQSSEVNNMVGID